MSGGKRAGAGRPKGARNKLRVELEAILARVQRTIGQGQTPLEYLLTVIRDAETEPALRLAAARAAAPFVHRRQPQAVQIESNTPAGVVIVTPMTEDTDADGQGDNRG